MIKNKLVDIILKIDDKIQLGEEVALQLDNISRELKNTIKELSIEQSIESKALEKIENINKLKTKYIETQTVFDKINKHYKFLSKAVQAIKKEQIKYIIYLKH